MRERITQKEPTLLWMANLNSLICLVNRSSLKVKHLRFRECLPEECPPKDADEITEILVVYRLVRTDPPLDGDFRSQRAENPSRRFNVSECMARGVSVFSDADVARDILRLRSQRGKLICELTLNKGAGYILNTGRKSHFTWWPLADFHVFNSCRVVDQ